MSDETEDFKGVAYLYDQQLLTFREWFNAVTAHAYPGDEDAKTVFGMQVEHALKNDSDPSIFVVRNQRIEEAIRFGKDWKKMLESTIYPSIMEEAKAKIPEELIGLLPEEVQKMFRDVD